MPKKSDISIVKHLYDISNNYFLIKEILRCQLILLEDMTSTLTSTLKIDFSSVLLLSLLVDYSHPGGKIPIDEIEGLVRLESYNVLLLQKALDKLMKKKYLKINETDDTDEVTYSISDELARMISKLKR